VDSDRQSLPRLPLNRWHLLLAALIAYGTLYPFDFVRPVNFGQALAAMLSDARLWTSRGDVLGNLALFVPWGLVSAWTRADGRMGWLAALAGLALAFVLQVLQIIVPSRDAAIADVVWNGVGIVVGQFALAPLAQRLLGARVASFRDQPLPLALAVLWLATQTAPFLPSLDLSLLRAHVRAFISPADWSLAAFSATVASVLVLGHIALTLLPSRAALATLATTLVAVVGGRMFIVDGAPHWHDAATMTVGFLAVAAVDAPRRLAPVAFAAMLLAMTLAGLAPYAFAGPASGFDWIPFAGYLRGNMALNLHELLDTVWHCAALLWLARAMGANVRGIGVFVVFWVLLLEFVQMWLPGRGASITPALTCALVTMAFVRAAAYTSLPTSDREPSTSPVSFPRKRESSGVQSDRSVELDSRFRGNDCEDDRGLFPVSSVSIFVVLAGFVWLAATGTLVWLIHQPGAPYNLRELFVANGHPAVVALFLASLLWLGAGPRLALDCALGTRAPAPALVGLLCVAGLLTFWLFSLSVTYESFQDIVGSNDWQLPLPHVERAARFVALYLPAAALLALALAIVEFRLRPRQLAFMALALAPLLWLSKLLVFDRASTDNLTELVAPHGVVFLALLLAVLAVNVALVSAPPGSRRWQPLLCTLVALPVSWLLLTHGLEQAVEKYGMTFPAQRFLLGPDRGTPLDAQSLQLRWAALYLALTIVGAVGVAAARFASARLKAIRAV